MSRRTLTPTLALLLAACIQDPGFDRRSGAVGEGEDGGPGGDTAGCEPEAVAPALPTVRQDLSSWTCREDGAAQPVAFFDADSTLRVSRINGKVTADDPTDVYILPFVARRIAELDAQGYLVAIVSNQGGVASGFPIEFAEGALAFTVSQLGTLGARVHYFDFAEAYDDFRKPKPGMGTRLDGLLTARCGAGVDRARSLMIGDSAYKKNSDGPSPDGRPADDFSNADRLFAASYGVWFAEPKDAFHWRDFGVYNIASADELRAFVDVIDAEAARIEAAHEDPSRAVALRLEADSNRRVNGFTASE